MDVSSLIERLKDRLACAEHSLAGDDDNEVYVEALALERETIAALEAHNTEADALREALTKCRDKFAEYVKLHKAKLLPERTADEFYQNARTAHNEGVRQKVEHNQEMVDLCDAALKQELK